MGTKLRDIDIEEIALVKGDSAPVNDDARIELVKATAAQTETPDVDETLVQRIAKAIKAVVTRKADDGDGDGDDDDVQVSEGGTHGAYSGTHTHDHQDGTGEMHSHEHSHDGDGDHGHAHMSKAREGLSGDVHEVEHLLMDAQDHLEKADVGAAVMAPARQHVAAMRAEAQAFLRLLQQTADGSPGPVTKAQSEVEMTNEEITQAIGAALEGTVPAAIAKALEPLQDAVAQKVRDEMATQVQEQVKDQVAEQVAPIAKAADEAIAKATAVEDQQAEDARKKPAVAPILNGAGLAHQAPAAKDVSGMTYSGALRTLLHD